MDGFMIESQCVQHHENDAQKNILLMIKAIKLKRRPAHKTKIEVKIYN